MFSEQISIGPVDFIDKKFRVQVLLVFFIKVNKKNGISQNPSVPKHLKPQQQKILRPKILKTKHF